MTIRETILAAATGIVLLLDTPILAEGCLDCGPPDPSPSVTSRQSDSDNAYTPNQRIYYGACTCDRFTVAWGFETQAFREEMARSQCLMLRHKQRCEVTDQSYIPGELK